MKKITVLIVDDSAFMRKMISDMIGQDDALEVVGSARNGADAIKKYQSLDPDIVTLDIELPDINGLDLLTKLLELKAKPIIMLSTLTQRGAEITFRAIERGAVDFVSKPSGAISLDISKIQRELVDKIKLSLTAKITYQLPHSAPSVPIQLPDHYKIKDSACSLLFIGSSTGGPRALQEVVTKLPKDLPVPVLIVQHMPPKFTKSLADRLNHLSHLSVKEAEAGDRLKKGMVYLAPGGMHMKVKAEAAGTSIYLTEEPPIHGVRPACDALLASLGDLQELNMITVILTGMGKDGTDGLRTIKDKHSIYSIAESEKTSVVYGMPKAVYEAGLVDIVCDLEEIPEEIFRQLYEKRG